MKILVLADDESKVLYEHFDPEKIRDVDLILACGDLRRNYLDFFASVSRAPVLYVLGNHDHWNKEERIGGCICIEDDIYVYKGVRILGLGGSMRYRQDAVNQYTEQQMEKRIRHLWLKLRRRKGFDILLTHAPAKGLNDMADLPHQGFACFLELLEKYQPKFFIHGHVHATYGKGFKRKDKYQNTTVINAYDHYIIEYPET